MNNIERDAGTWLTRYADEERPPHHVDIMIRTKIRRAARHQTSKIWIGVWAIAAATLLLLWAVVPDSPPHRGVGDDSFSALHAAGSSLARVATGRPLEARAMPAQTSTPAPNRASEEPDEPGSAALLTARLRIDSGDFKGALERLEPCASKVGTDALLDECELMAIEAWCALGNIAAVRQRIAAFHLRSPHSLHVNFISTPVRHALDNDARDRPYDGHEPGDSSRRGFRCR